MTISLNGQAHLTESPLPVTELLEQLGLTGKPVVVELNREPVLPGDHANTIIEEGATIEIVTLAAGG